MNRTEITNYLTNPELVANASSNELRKLTEIYPYCEALHWIYLRSLYINDDATFDDELLQHGMHISNRRLFYNYLTEEIPSEAITNQINIDEKSKATSQSITPIPIQTPDYFALEQNQEQKQSLQQLAAQLKAARLARQTQKQQEAKTSTTIKPTAPKRDEKTITKEKNQEFAYKNNNITPEITEDYAKKLIKEQKYLEAIEILKAISLNNPKKSANFALQIKFLETIINNHNKK